MTATRPPPKAVSSDEYARTALRVAVCQLAEAAGYGSARASAADALADVTARYAVALGRSAKGYAEAAGRGAANVADVLMTLDDAGVSVDDLRTYIEADDEVPFAHALPSFPVRRSPRPLPSFDAVGEAPPPHVPGFLPAFPDAHTHAATPLYPGRGGGNDAAADAATAAAAGEAALVGLEERARSGGARGARAAGEAVTTAAGVATAPWRDAGAATAAAPPFTSDRAEEAAARAAAGRPPPGAEAPCAPDAEPRSRDRRGAAAAEAVAARAEALLEAAGEEAADMEEGE